MATKSLVTIEHRFGVPDQFRGVVVAQSRALLLLHEVNDFQFDGYHVIRNENVIEASSSDADKYYASLMKQEGNWESVPERINDLPLSSWLKLIREFIGQVIILENEYNMAFYMGRVEELTRANVVIREFDDCGEWADLVVVPFSRITSMRFGDRFSTTFAKYLKEPS